jgi:hypothetical protein
MITVGAKVSLLVSLSIVQRGKVTVVLGKRSMGMVNLCAKCVTRFGLAGFDTAKNFALATEFELGSWCDRFVTEDVPIGTFSHFCQRWHSLMTTCSTIAL